MRKTFTPAVLLLLLFLSVVCDSQLLAKDKSIKQASTQQPSLQSTPDLSKYITLTVKPGAGIRLRFKAANSNTPIRIVSGSKTEDITVGNDDFSYFSMNADGNTMVVYGDINGFDSGNNDAGITSLDVSKNTQLQTLHCSSNILTSPDVSKNYQLEFLDCYNNQLTSLDVSKNTQLKELQCDLNQLTTLDLSKNTQLKRLWCDRNQLTTLDLSKNTQLKDLTCFNNQLTTLDLSKNYQLEFLVCYNNQLTSLDVSKNYQLEFLDCYNNQLTSLDVSKNTQLKFLECYYNQLTSLDVSKNTQLKDLRCYNNQLTSLDVSKNYQLEFLVCYNNQLTSLDVSKNYQLEFLDCQNNQLTSLDVSKNTQLKELRCYGNPFTTEAVNKLYCSLPSKQNGQAGICYTLDAYNDLNHEAVLAATSDNARQKNWHVRYYNTTTEIPSNGNYVCGSDNNDEPDPTPGDYSNYALKIHTWKSGLNENNLQYIAADGTSSIVLEVTGGKIPKGTTLTINSDDNKDFGTVYLPNMSLIRPENI